jgi:hypothetical protein
VIEAERHSHVFYEAEPDIWMVMVCAIMGCSLKTWVVFMFECILLNHFTWVPNLAVGGGEK